MMAGASSRRIIWTTVLIAGAVALVVFYGLVDPATSPFVPRCMFHTLTGLECPGCGSQRAIHALLRGDFVAAWEYNALVVAGILPVAVYIYAEATRTCNPRLYARLNSMPAIITAAVVILVWSVGRNLI